MPNEIYWYLIISIKFDYEKNIHRGVRFTVLQKQLASVDPGHVFFKTNNSHIDIGNDKFWRQHLLNWNEQPDNITQSTSKSYTYQRGFDVCKHTGMVRIPRV